MTASFEIEQSASSKIRVELISMGGTIIYSTTYTIVSGGPQLVSIDDSAVGKLVEGMYIVRVTLDNGDTFTNTVIKNQY
jgi:hypothetical protein